jgi:phage terminase large subunit
LRGSVLRDFIEILTVQEYYDPAHHNKTENLYTLFGNTWEFISVDESMKIRGRKRQIAFLNEANELTLEDFRQLALRTTERLILDYNPSHEYHWIYDEVIPRDDATFFKTTYLDNPYLSRETISEIERLRETDENYWRVYGLGERGMARETIFQTTEYDALPDGASLVAHGLDWGYANDPTAVVRVFRRGDELFIEELLYRGGLTNPDIVEQLRELGLARHDLIVADSAEPKSIDELHRNGFNIKPARKGPDSVRIGIDAMRRFKLHIHKKSLNTQKEFRNYKWKTDKNLRVLNQPVDEWNHAIDAVRYVCLNQLLKKSGTYFLR